MYAINFISTLTTRHAKSDRCADVRWCTAGQINKRVGQGSYGQCLQISRVFYTVASLIMYAFNFTSTLTT